MCKRPNDLLTLQISMILRYRQVEYDPGVHLIKAERRDKQSFLNAKILVFKCQIRRLDEMVRPNWYLRKIPFWITSTYNRSQTILQITWMQHVKIHLSNQSLMKNIFTAFLLLMAGIVVAISGLWMEWFLFKFFKRKSTEDFPKFKDFNLERKRLKHF